MGSLRDLLVTQSKKELTQESKSAERLQMEEGPTLMNFAQSKVAEYRELKSPKEATGEAKTSAMKLESHNPGAQSAAQETTRAATVHQPIELVPKLLLSSIQMRQPRLIKCQEMTETMLMGMAAVGLQKKIRDKALPMR